MLCFFENLNQVIIQDADDEVGRVEGPEDDDDPGIEFEHELEAPESF